MERLVSRVALAFEGRRDGRYVLLVAALAVGIPDAPAAVGGGIWLGSAEGRGVGVQLEGVMWLSEHVGARARLGLGSVVAGHSDDRLTWTTLSLYELQPGIVLALHRGQIWSLTAGGGIGVAAAAEDTYECPGQTWCNGEHCPSRCTPIGEQPYRLQPVLHADAGTRWTPTTRQRFQTALGFDLGWRRVGDDVDVFAFGLNAYLTWGGSTTAPGTSEAPAEPQPQRIPMHARPGYRRHDGLYLNLALGSGYVTATTDRGGSPCRMDGLAFAPDGEVGVAVIENVIAYSKLSVTVVDNAAVTAGLRPRDAPGDFDVGIVTVGLGLATYLPANFKVSAAVSAAQLRAEFRPDDPEGQSSELESNWGPLLQLGFAKEWWVGNDWALGAAARLAIGRLPADTSELEPWNVRSMVLALSATFN
jgi:hypothetical protein